jgi:uncharacterized protein (TIGR03435 family)
MKFTLLCVVTTFTALAQQFDVSVIKPADPANTRNGMGFGPNGRTVTVDGLTLRQIAREAYNVFPSQMIVNPALPNSGWIDSDRYDISGKTDGDTPVSKEIQNRMLQQLLAQRFALQVHHESLEITIYSLTIAKNGLKLNPPGTGGPYLSGPAPGKLIGQQTTMASLARALGGVLGRPTLDDTGVTGGYDFALTWAPNELESADSTGPSLFSALQEQLGLKLESKKAPMDVIVIDHAEKPSAN